MKRLLIASALLLGSVPLSVRPCNHRGNRGAGRWIGTYLGGTVVIQNGRSSVPGLGCDPRGAEIVDARGKWVSPGIIGGLRVWA